MRAAAAVVLAVGAGLIAWALLRRDAATGLDWRGHIEDLRRRVLVSLGAVLAVTAFLFSFRWPAGAWWPTPAVQHNLAAQAFQRLATDLVPEGVRLVVVRPMDGFMAEMTVAFGLGVVLASPIVLWQLGGFFTPALRPAERRALRMLFVPALGLFLLGAAFAYFWVLPFLLATLYSYGTALGAEPLLQVSELISFTVGLVLVLGLAFQTPLVMYGLSRAGIVRAGTWTKYWRHAVVVIFLASAIVTDPTVVSQVMVAVPLLLLYGLGIMLARGGERGRSPSP